MDVMSLERSIHKAPTEVQSMYDRYLQGMNDTNELWPWRTNKPNWTPNADVRDDRLNSRQRNKQARSRGGTSGRVIYLHLHRKAEEQKIKFTPGEDLRDIPPHYVPAPPRGTDHLRKTSTQSSAAAAADDGEAIPQAPAGAWDGAIWKKNDSMHIVCALGRIEQGIRCLGVNSSVEIPTLEFMTNWYALGSPAEGLPDMI